MQSLLRISDAIDSVNTLFARLAAWLVLFACLISAGNAVSRYLFNASSNSWLEIQWQMFAGVFLLGAAYTFKLNEHVRVDLFYGGASDRTKLWIDVFGLCVFFFPATFFIAWFSVPFFLTSFASGETSSNAGGLVQWPVKALLPLGFILLICQGLSELIKRVAALMGELELTVSYEKPLQ